MPGLIRRDAEAWILPQLKYDVIIDSSKVGAIKPESQIFEIATQSAGVAPEQILLVERFRTNLMAAEKMGWHVSWFDDYPAKRIF